MTNGVLYGVMLESLVEIYLRFGGGISTQEREHSGFSEIAVDLCHNIWCHVLEDGIARRRNFKCHIRHPTDFFF